MGMVLFVLARVASERRAHHDGHPAVAAPLLASLIILTYVPAISLWLPRLIGHDPVNAFQTWRSTT